MSTLSLCACICARSKIFFAKLAKYIGHAIKALVDKPDGKYCFRLHRDRVYYVNEAQVGADLLHACRSAASSQMPTSILPTPHCSLQLAASPCRSNLRRRFQEISYWGWGARSASSRSRRSSSFMSRVSTTLHSTRSTRCKHDVCEPVPILMRIPLRILHQPIAGLAEAGRRAVLPIRQPCAQSWSRQARSRIGTGRWVSMGRGM